MSPALNPRFLAFHRTLTTACALSVQVIGALVLLGWIFDLSSLKHLAPGLASMKPNTALAFILEGLALWFLGRPETTVGRTRAARGAAALAALLGLLTLGEYLLGSDFGLDQVLFRDTEAGLLYPGRMSPATAVDFILFGAVLLLLDVPWARRLRAALMVGGTLIALLALVGYGLSVRSLYAVGAFTPIALHTSAAFLLLSAGLLFARPTAGLAALLASDTVGGQVARRLLPGALFIPLLLGWFRLLGERADLYDGTFGLALYAVTNVGVIGGLVAWIAFALDRADRDRRLAEERFRATFEQAAVGVALLSPEGRWLRVNRKLCDIVGYPPAELLQKTFQDITHPEDLDADLALARRVLAGDLETYTLEKRYFRKDASIVWINLTVSLVRAADGAPEYFIAVVEDISRRRAAEDSLRMSEARFRSLSESELIGIIVADFEGRILEANPAFLKMVGYGREDVDAGRIRLDELTPSVFREQDQHAIAQLKAGGVAPPWQKEYIRKDGSRMPVLVGVSPLKGSAAAVVAFALDLSEKRRLEEQLRHAQRMEIVGRLAGGVAHDFNNLLTPILGYCEMLLAQLRPGERFWEEVEQIRSSGDRAAALTRQLLAFSRKQVLKPKVVSLNTVVADVQKLLRRVIGEDIAIDLRLDPGLGAVEVDPTQMDQVLLNLAVNARDAMPAGGRILIETTNVQMDEAHVSSHPELVSGPYVLLSLSDTGTGMDAVTLGRLFEPFFTTKELGKGTGLGLATVQGIVRQSGGHIWVYSEPGHGTTFKIYFPAVRSAAGTDLRPKPGAVGAAGGTETLLLVEDDAALRTFAVRALEGKGYRILAASSGEGALQAAQAHPGAIHLCLTDVVMPGLSGRDTASRLQALRPDLKVLFMSGYSGNTVAKYGVLEQGVDLLEKPFTAGELVRRVREILDRPAGGDAGRSQDPPAGR